MKIIKITNCINCPYMWKSEGYNWCMARNSCLKLGNHDLEIPEWCHLEEQE